jgi:glucosamine--fructose-6-phosphate aminotransferase (isomerizing)
MGIQAGLPVALAAPSIHTLYEAPPNLSRALVIGISQSGQAQDVRTVIADAKKQGALTVSITNDADSPLARVADYQLPLSVGKELAVAATKTYTGELAAIALIVTSLIDKHQDEMAKLPDYLTETLQLSEGIAEWVQRYRYMERFAVIGRGYNYCTAFEVSLKIKELCSITGVEYSEADFRHGPIALLQSGFPVITVAPSGITLPGMIDLLKRLTETYHAECLVISDDDKACGFAQSVMRLPRGIPEWLTPVVAVVPGQIFAMRLAGVKGFSLDAPTGLTKVTITA